MSSFQTTPEASAGRVLHVLGQRPGLTGSGMTLGALVRESARRGWEQHVVCALPAAELSSPGAYAGLELGPERIHPLGFGGPDLPFDVPGMSDVMPYPSTRFSSLSEAQLERYRRAWHEHLARVIEATRPDVIHTHHVWIVSALLAELAEDQAVVLHVHATGLRQLELCPQLAASVLEGCRQHQRFCVLHSGHARALEHKLGIDPQRIRVVGAGYRDDLFGSGSSERDPNRILYAGKLSRAKGVAELRTAFERLRATRPDLELRVAGAGAGPEGDELQRELANTPGVTLLGRLESEQLAVEMQAAHTFCLPSYYEGLPLVLVEAAASGCRLVSTALPGVSEQLAPVLGARLELVDLPAMSSIDQPVDSAKPEFAAALADALGRSLDAPAAGALDLASFRWRAVAERVATAWGEAQLEDRG